MRKTEEEDVRVVRALPRDLERVLEGLPRTSDRTKDWARAHFVGGQTPSDIARDYDVAPQHVGNKIRVIRAKLIEQASPLTYVMADVALPIALGKELQGLAGDLKKRRARGRAEESWQTILRAVVAARKRLNEESANASANP